MVQQLTIFDAVPIQNKFEINDLVEVVMDPDERDVETYFYLPKYAGLKGRVVKVIHTPDLQYEVQYEKKERVGVFRQSELRRELDE